MEAIKVVDIFLLLPRYGYEVNKRNDYNYDFIFIFELNAYELVLL